MTVFIDIISQIRKLDGTFSKQEQRVADFVLTNLRQIPFLRQSEIAESANVSVATVNRFCITLGCAGFKECKIRLAQSIAVNLQFTDNSPSKTSSEANQLVEQVFSELVEVLNLARNQLQAETLEVAIDILAQAQRISFFGVGGGSANVAREGANRFFRLGIPSEAHSDGYLQRMLASTLQQGDVVLAISSSGQPAELIDSVSIAKHYGAKTISLTRPDSPLAKASEVTIEIDIPEDQDIYKPTASRFVFFSIIDVLAAGTARKHPENVKEYLKRIRTTLVTLNNDTTPSPIGD